MAKHQHSLAAHQAEYFRSALCYQTDMQYWNTVARAELLQVATDYYELYRLTHQNYP